MIDTEIEKIIETQVNQQQVKPTEEDIVPFSCLFFTDNTGNVNFKTGKDACIPRVELLFSILNNMILPANISFLFLTHDYSDPIHYENKKNFSTCFGKLKNQDFITIPNWSLLNGLVDHLCDNVRTHDIPTMSKAKKSIFAGGPNCYQDGTRIKYAINKLDPQDHIIILSNCNVSPISGQLQFLFTVNIDGHSLCYDRLYWQMLSNSLPVYIERSQDILQLHDILIKPNVHYFPSTVESWSEDFQKLQNKTEEIITMIQNGKDFIDKHFQSSAKQESIRTFEYIIRKIAERQRNL